MLRKLFLYSDGRKGRLRDYHGQSVSLSRLVRNGGKAVGSGVVRLMTGRFPAIPWIAYDGQALIERHLNSGSKVLEFGSGSSTLWYAARAGKVVSVEDNKAWYENVRSKLAAKDNVDYRFCATLAEYLAIGDPGTVDRFDMIMIDGTARDQCVEIAIPLLAPNGMIYLDNSDMYGDDHTGDVPRARALLHEHAAAHGKRIMTLTDFTPTQFYVSEATLLFN